MNVCRRCRQTLGNPSRCGRKGANEWPVSRSGSRWRNCVCTVSSPDYNSERATSTAVQLVDLPLLSTGSGRLEFDVLSIALAWADLPYLRQLAERSEPGIHPPMPYFSLIADSGISFFERRLACNRLSRETTSRRRDSRCCPTGIVTRSPAAMNCP